MKTKKVASTIYRQFAAELLELLNKFDADIYIGYLRADVVFMGKGELDSPTKVEAPIFQQLMVKIKDENPVRFETLERAYLKNPFKYSYDPATIKAKNMMREEAEERFKAEIENKHSSSNG